MHHFQIHYMKHIFLPHFAVGVIRKTSISNSWKRSHFGTKRYLRLCPVKIAAGTVHSYLAAGKSSGGQAWPSITHPCLKWEEESVASMHHSWRGFWGRGKRKAGEEMNEYVKAGAIEHKQHWMVELVCNWMKGGRPGENIGIDLNVSSVILLFHNHFEREPNDLISVTFGRF